MSVTIVSATKNYQGLCLLVDEGMTLESDTVRDMIRLAYLPVVRLHKPKIALSQSAATLIHHRLEEILHYLDSDNPRKAAVLEHLYAVFLLEVQNELEQSSEAGKAGKHKEDVFISFLSLLSESFAEHHDIPFYAGELNITTTYLSRVVR